ncbi:hypothetical protein PstZobell_10329 [Stutzerimonas stutzeri ATCC 14405 = CCUG 16156]|uniref:hypothetical protein n=1 Tax=Stutzerimonas stutzeri TaxID=316 RepID=UPI0002549854|nr:hypothetical protein [Stutzerimonas stutzeri]EHY77822.1 hypothetical protein PstZobell_10329 [Stutzerimonas stutzeri ATCC 14405 = CCUG 16156]QOZ96759.1 hypothetical protein Pstu14405_16135 [Stutzerimonas stutzeri]
MTIQNTKQHVQQPMVFSPEVLAERQAKAIERYKGSHAACQHVDEPILIRYTEKVIELVAAGYSLNEKLPCRSGNHSYSAYFSKPAAMQEQEIEALKLEVEEKYRNEIAEANARNEELLAQQLYEAEKRKLEEAERKKDEKLREQARKEAADFFASIKEGK